MADKPIVIRTKPPLWTRVKTQKFLLLMLLPGVIWYLLFKYLPLLGLSLGFTDYGFRAKVSFVGLENFQRLLSSSIFWNAFRNTMIKIGRAHV